MNIAHCPFSCVFSLQALTWGIFFQITMETHQAGREFNVSVTTGNMTCSYATVMWKKDASGNNAHFCLDRLFRWQTLAHFLRLFSVGNLPAFLLTFHLSSEMHWSALKQKLCYFVFFFSFAEKYYGCRFTSVEEVVTTKYKCMFICDVTDAVTKEIRILSPTKVSICDLSIKWRKTKCKMDKKHLYKNDCRTPSSHSQWKSSPRKM